MRCMVLALVLLLVPVAGAQSVGTTVDDVLGLAPLRTVAWDGGTGVWGDGAKVLIVEASNADGHEDLRPCLADSRFAVGPTDVPASSNDPILTASGHGSWVAGSICGTGTLLPGHHGIAPGAGTYSWNGFLGLDDDEAQHAYHEEHGFRLMSHSLVQDPKPYWAPLRDGADMTVFWAAGNEGGDGSTDNTLGNDDPRNLMVAAATGDGTGIASYSSRGLRSDPDTWPDLTAPGCRYVPHALHDQWIKARWTDDPEPGDCIDDAREAADEADYRLVWGTSFATPTAAGVGAMMMQVHPDMTPADLRHVLTATARPFLPTTDQDGDGEVTRHDFWLQHGYAAGHGMVDPVRAVAAAHAMAQGVPRDEAVACATIQDGAFVVDCPEPRDARPTPPDTTRPPGPPAPPVERNPVASLDEEPGRDATLPFMAPLVGLATTGLRLGRR